MGAMKLIINILILFAIQKSFECAGSENQIPAIIKNLQNHHNFGADSFEFLQLRGEGAASDAECARELMEIAQNASQGHKWALQFIDAWGRLPSGLLVGSSFDLGNYDECVNIATAGHRGQYCLASIPVTGAGLPAGPLGQSYKLNIGTCVAASCSAKYLDTWIREFLNDKFQLHVNSTIVNADSCYVKQSRPLSAVAIVALIIFGVLAFITLASTLYHYQRGGHKSLPAFVRAFSLRQNGALLFRVTENENRNVISCLNGIRCFSLMWVIFGHDLMTMLALPNINSMDILEWVQTPFAMLLTQAYFSVDSFFFLSGLLVATVALREMHRNSGKLNVPLMYLHRYLRLTPILAYAIPVYMSMNFVSDGPLWHKVGPSPSVTPCAKNWWSTLLYVQNYVNPDEQCIGNAWYLAVDTQLYVLSPIFLFAAYRWDKKAIAGTLVVLLLGAGALFATIMINDDTMFWKKQSADPQGSIRRNYFSTHVRASPWLIGFILGYYLHKIKGKQIKLNKLIQLVGWSLCFLLFATCIFVLYPKSQADATPLTTFEEALFFSLTRIAWPLGLSWLVFACVQGYGGPINSFLGHPLWQPLARLSYSMYIFHMVILLITGGITRTGTYFSSYQLMLRFWYDYGFTILLSVVMYLVIEAPIAGLIQTLMPKRKTALPPKSQSTETILAGQSSHISIS